MTSKNLPAWRILIGIGALALLSGCASTAEIMRDDPDPFERYNRAMFTFNDRVDKAVLKPVAEAYQAVTPEPVDRAIGNFFSNLNDVVVALNNLLQYKFEPALMDTTRVVYNTTFGVLGFFDVASHMDLPKHNEDFGQTLGYWGVGEGYYLVLPFLGPSTTRDALGLVVDFQIDPIWSVESTGTRVALYGVNAVDTRAGLLQAERAFMEAAIDPYAFQREAYLQRRRHLVYDGDPPRPVFDDFDDFEDDLE
jgi:phospholipid-binding lipoprotein MlaA